MINMRVIKAKSARPRVNPFLVLLNQHVKFNIIVRYMIGGNADVVLNTDVINNKVGLPLEFDVETKPCPVLQKSDLRRLVA